MADNVTANPGTGGATFASDDIAGIQYPRGKITLGADGVNDGDVSSSNPMPVGGTLLTTIANNLPTQGQKTMAGSQPVTIASDQSAVPISAASLPLPTGAATAALQTTGNTSLASIDGKLGSLGQKLMAGSAPVVIASDQSAIPVSGTVSVNALPTGANTIGAVNLAQYTPVTGRLPVDGSGVTQPVSGTVTANAGTGTFAISAAALPLPTGAATETTLSAINTKTPSLATAVPAYNASAEPTREVGESIWACSFAAVGASVLSTDFTSPIVGTGVTYNQTAGSLNILTGTGTNAEFLTRSTVAFQGSLRMRASIVASQRIANQNLMITLADLIGEALTYNIVSATVVNVTKTAHGFTSQNVGQFMNLGGITGAAGVPGRYSIAAIVDANTIQFTVAGWPATGTGTLSLFGWNYYRNLVTGVTATNIAWDAQRRGWATGDTTATINTTASPGTIIQNDANGRDAFLMDALRATATSPTFTTRASRYENLPDPDVQLYVWIWSFNGTVAPASTTTWTLGFISVETFANLPIYVQGLRANGTANALPVNIASPATLPVSLATNTPTLAAGTNLAADVGVQIRATTNGTTVTNILSAASNNLTQLKATAGKIAGGFLTNTTASLQYVKLFNVPSASVTPGTTAATTQIALQPNQTVPLHQGDLGIFIGGTGLTIMIVTGSALTDNTATTAGSVVGFIAWV